MILLDSSEFVFDNCITVTVNWIYWVLLTLWIVIQLEVGYCQTRCHLWKKREEDWQGDG